MRISKMHGLGNSFVLVYGKPDGTSPETAREICAAEETDGLIYVSETEGVSERLTMRIFNSDGSEPQMCGNGIRCAAGFAEDIGLVTSPEKPVYFDTLAGERIVRILGDGMYSVDMGKGAVGEEFTLGVSSGDVDIIPVNMGNPHAVIFVSDAEKADVSGTGREVCFSPVFPEGTNVEFVSVKDSSHLRMRVWERGCGITKACGTGACASVCAAAAKGFVNAKTPVGVELDGGVLEISVDDRGHVIMDGPAEYLPFITDIAEKKLI